MKSLRKKKLLLRLVAFPIILLLMIVTHLYNAIRNSLLFLWFGGEWITYEKENDTTMIYDVYNVVKDELIKK